MLLLLRSVHNAWLGLLLLLLLLLRSVHNAWLGLLLLLLLLLRSGHNAWLGLLLLLLLLVLAIYGGFFVRLPFNDDYVSAGSAFLDTFQHARGVNRVLMLVTSLPFSELHLLGKFLSGGAFHLSHPLLDFRGLPLPLRLVECLLFIFFKPFLFLFRGKLVGLS